jgi:SAM-dependent methyltransferase
MSFVISQDRPDLGGNFRHGDVHTFVPRLWRYLVERFAIDSVLDVGCGEGHAVRFFHKHLGVYAHGIDGLIDNIRHAVFPIALHDLLASSYYMPVDLVWSCEVAEHIDPEKVDNFIATLASGRVVAMTHAVPGQEGYHHVNLQAPEYWIGKMEEKGYQLDPQNEFFREIAGREETWNYFARTGLVFNRNRAI